MRGGAVLFVLALAASAATFALLVLPAQREAAGFCAALEGTDIEGRRRRAAAWPGPTPEETRRLEEALLLFTPPVPTAPLPEGLAEDGSGVVSGRIPWVKVQDLLAWVASRTETILSVEVRPAPGSPDLAACRVVVEGERAP